MIPTIKRIGPFLILVFTVLPFLSIVSRIAANMSFSYILNILAFVLLGIVLIVNTTKIYFPKYLMYYSLFALYTILSDFFIVNKSFDFKYLYSNGLLASVFLIFFIENGKYTEIFVNKYLKFNVLILYIALAVIIIQQVVNSKFLVDPNFVKDYFFANNDTQMRLPSIYSYIGGSITVGLSFLPILGYVIADSLKNAKKDYVILFIMGALFSFLTKYRWIMINYIVLLILIPLYKKLNIIRVLLIIVSIALSLFAGYFLLEKLNVPVDKYLQDRIFETNSGGISHSSAGTRLLAFEIFSELFPQNPLWGKGERLWTYGGGVDTELMWALKGRSSQIHVGYLSLLYTYGIVGAILYILFLIFILKKLYQDALIHKNWGIFLAFVGFVLANTTLVQFTINDMGLLIVLAFNNYLLEKETLETKVLDVV